jgi:hypothetical protein
MGVFIDRLRALGLIFFTIPARHFLELLHKHTRYRNRWVRYPRSYDEEERGPIFAFFVGKRLLDLDDGSLQVNEVHSPFPFLA